MDLRAHTRVAFAQAARESADHARHLVVAVAEDQAPGSRIRAARTLRSLDLTVLDLAVLVELADGATWQTVADALRLPLDEAIRRYRPTYDEWIACSLDPTPAGAAAAERMVGTVTDADPASTAESLDLWAERTGAPWDAPVERPVSRVLV